MHEVPGELSLREIQLVSLEILQVIDSICSKESLTYYLVHGSLLGAVRHGGYIPWDDDLDIAMSRPHYDRFLNYFEKHSDELLPLVAIHNSSSRKLPFLITRISDTRYCEVGEYSFDAPETGVFVDVYPLDGCGGSREEARRARRACLPLIMKYARAGNFVSNNVGCSPMKKAIKTIRAKALGPCEKYEAALMADATAEHYEASKFVSCKTWFIPQIADLVIDKDDLGEGLLVPFEDMTVRIPVGYDTILRDEYGEYMTLPPVSQRVGHHNYSVVTRN